MDELKTVTIKEVAKLANVSLGTVSNVLRGSKSVKEKNKISVLNAMKVLNFSPNVFAQNLKTNKTSTIGLMLPTIDNPFYPAVVKGVEDYANKEGFSVILCNTNRNANKEKEYLQMLNAKRVEGVIMLKTKVEHSILQEYKKQMKLILVDTLSGENTDIDVLEVDNYGGCIKMLKHLYDLGHTQIAFITGERKSKSANERYRAYLNFLTENDIALQKEYVKNGDYSWNSGYEVTRDLLSLPNVPTAIFAANDLMAIGAMKAIRERGLIIPRDISVCGFDDIDMCKFVTPTLTTVYHPAYEQGEVVAQLLISRLKESKNYPETTKSYKLGTELVVRESTGQVRKADDGSLY